MLNRYVRQGDSIRRAATARQWNEFIRATDAQLVSAGMPSQGEFQVSSENPVLTAQLTNTATQADAKDIRGILQPSILPAQSDGDFERWMKLDATTPIPGKFVIANGAIEPDAGGLATISGVISCRLFVESNGDWINRADVDTTDATRLRALPNGSAQILWKEAGTNTEVNAIVRLGNPEFVALPGKANGVITAGSSGTVRIWQNTTTDTNYDISGVLLDWMAGGLDISDGKEVLIGWFPDEQLWRVIGAECEDPPTPPMTFRGEWDPNF